MNPALHYRVASRWSDLDPLQAEWDELVADHPRPQVFFTFAWHKAAWRAFGEHRTLAVGLAFRRAESGADVLCAVLPLSKAASARDFEFLGGRHADYSDLLVRAGEDVGVVFRQLLATLEAAGVRRARLDQVPEGGWLPQAMAAVGSGRSGRILVRGGDVCPALVVEDDGTLAAVLRKKSLRRHEKGLAKRGAITFERLETRAAVHAAQGEFRRQHQQRRALVGDATLFAEARTCAFYDALIDELDPATVLHFTVLRCGAEVAAFHFGFQSGGVLTWYKPTIAVDLWDLGPGEVLIKRLLETVRDQDLCELDFTRGDEAFKQRFANRRRRNTDYVLLPTGLVGRWLRAKMWVGDAIRARPTLHRVLRRGRDQVREVRRVVGKHRLKLFGKVVALGWRTFGVVTDEVIVFGRQRAESAADGHPELAIELGSLATLATAAGVHPDYFDARRLQSARKRLKQGDRLLVAWWGEGAQRKLAHAAWFGQRDKIVATEVGTEIEIPLPHVGTVLYDCWTPPSMRGRGIYPAVLQRMAALASTEDLWIYCLADNLASRRGIERAGFVATHRMTRRRRLGRRVGGAVEYLG